MSVNICSVGAPSSLTLFLPDLVTWRSYMGWFRPWPVGIGLINKSTHRINHKEILFYFTHNTYKHLRQVQPFSCQLPITPPPWENPSTCHNVRIQFFWPERTPSTCCLKIPDPLSFRESIHKRGFESTKESCLSNLRI